MSDNAKTKYAIDRFASMAAAVFARTRDGTATGADRAMLADLRHGFSATTGTRSWPHLLGPPVNANWYSDRDERIWVTVAATCATVGGVGSKQGNLGRTMREMAECSQEGAGQRQASPRDDALKRMEPRFKRLLVCRSAEKICDFLPGLAKRCARDAVAINATRLFWDLAKWEKEQKSIRIRWAESFWHVPSQKKEEAPA